MISVRFYVLRVTRNIRSSSGVWSLSLSILHLIEKSKFSFWKVEALPFSTSHIPTLEPMQVEALPFSTAHVPTLKPIQALSPDDTDAHRTSYSNPSIKARSSASTPTYMLFNSAQRLTFCCCNHQFLSEQIADLPGTQKIILLSTSERLVAHLVVLN